MQSGGPSADATRAPDDVDHGRFEALYRETRDDVVALCRRYVGNRADAEALAHDAFIRAWESWGRFASERPFWPWVATIARRLCINEMSRSARRTDIVVESARVLAGASVEDEVASATDRQEVRRVLHDLPPRQQRLLRLRDLEGWSYDDIARIEGVSVESVRGALKRARAAFRRVYERTGGVLGGLVPVLRRWAHDAERGIAGAGMRLFGREPLAALLAVLFMTSGAVEAAPPQALPRVPSVQAAGPIAQGAPTTALPSRPTATTTTHATAPPVAALAATGPTAGEAALDTVAGYGLTFTPSPSYSEDRTVFASATERCGIASPRVQWCPRYYRSDDGGSSWRPLRAAGAPGGRILLPPAYPRDPRVFLGGSALYVSEDGGDTFRIVSSALPPGEPALSPLFSEGDPRLFFGVPFLAQPLPAGMEFNIERGTLGPLSLPLPIGAVPVAFAFSPSYAQDRRVLVAGVHMAQDILERRSYQTPSAYLCSPDACERVVAFGGGLSAPKVAWSASGAAFAWTPYDLFRSDDGARTFAPVPLPGSRLVRMFDALHVGEDGGLSAFVRETNQDGLPPVSLLYRSRDGGRRWEPVDGEVEPLTNSIVLPDGTMLAARLDESTELWPLTCSRDGGRTWHDRCPA